MYCCSPETTVGMLVPRPEARSVLLFPGDYSRNALFLGPRLEVYCCSPETTVGMHCSSARG